MNTVLAFLSAHRDRLGTAFALDPAEFTVVAATPRFRASAHVIFFLLPPESAEPIFVLKVSRGAAQEAFGLRREARNLESIHALRPAGARAVPRALLFEAFQGSAMLLQSAVPGRVLTSGMVRSRPRLRIRQVMDWIVRFDAATASPVPDPASELDRLLARPLERFADEVGRALPDGLVPRTLELVGPLAHGGFPFVFEHGDLCAPNLLVSRHGALGVVDWERGEPRGLPAADLFVFLAFAASARGRRGRRNAPMNDVTPALLAPRTWATPWVVRYMDALGIARHLTRPLFVACWARYTLGLWRHLTAVTQTTDSRAHAVDWLLANRYLAAWRQAVEGAAAPRPPRRVLPVGNGGA